MSKIIWLTDRSRMGSYQDCHRLRYLNYHYGGTGLARKTRGLPLINGDFIHKALAHLITGGDVDDVIEHLSNDYRAQILDAGIANYGGNTEFLINEQLALLEGLTLAWDRTQKPKLLNEFEVVDVEREVRIELAPGVEQMIRLDFVARRKRDRRLVINEYKTVGLVNEGWTAKWEHDSQMLSNFNAGTQIYGERPEAIVIRGLIKGLRKKDTAKSSPFYGEVVQNSPFCYAYRSGKAPFTVVERNWSHGAEKVPVWELPGGVREHIAANFSDMDLEEMFVTVPVLPVKRDIGRWQRQMRAQENRIAYDVETVEILLQEWNAAKAAGDDLLTDEAAENFFDALDEFFPQNHNHCFRYFGHPCQFEALCFTEEIEADPMGSGLYEARTPHHNEDAEAA